MNNQIIIGSRGSELALIQSNEVKSILQAKYPHLNIHIQVISTRGDKALDTPISEIGGKGLFTAELEEGLINHEIDLAVHSMKDLPSKLNTGLKYAGSLKREDIRDAFVSKRWHCIQDVPEGGTIATGSVRRRAQLLAVRPDLNITSLRGNVDTRLKKLDENNWDGIIVAAAAMHRLDHKDSIIEYLDLHVHTPAAGQGALGLEIAEDRVDIYEIIQSIVNKDVTLCCTAEMSFLQQLGGGCSVPVGCFAQLKSDIVTITGYISNKDGSNIISKTIEGNRVNAERLAVNLADEMLSLQSKEISAL